MLFRVPFGSRVSAHNQYRFAESSLLDPSSVQKSIQGSNCVQNQQEIWSVWVASLKNIILADCFSPRNVLSSYSVQGRSESSRRGLRCLDLIFTLSMVICSILGLLNTLHLLNVLCRFWWFTDAFQTLVKRSNLSGILDVRRYLKISSCVKP